MLIKYLAICPVLQQQMLTLKSHIVHNAQSDQTEENCSNTAFSYTMTK